MASSYRIPRGYHLTDPDETEGRLLYRQRADAEARMQLAMTRKVRLATPETPPSPMAWATGPTSTSEPSRSPGMNPKSSTPEP